MNRKFDVKDTKAMPAGTFGVWATGMKHYVWIKGESVVQFHGIGPSVIEYVESNDDPRKVNK